MGLESEYESLSGALCVVLYNLLRRSCALFSSSRSGIPRSFSLSLSPLPSIDHLLLNPARSLYAPSRAACMMRRTAPFFFVRSGCDLLGDGSRYSFSRSTGGA